VPSYEWGFFSITKKIQYFYKQTCMHMPTQAPTIPGGRGSQILKQSAHEGGKVVSPTHRSPLHPDTPFYYSQGPSAVRRITSMKNSDDVIRNRIRKLSSSSAEPQPTAPPNTAFYKHSYSLTFPTTVNCLARNIFQEFRTTKKEHKI
jgi:hypothetical protein